MSHSSIIFFSAVITLSILCIAGILLNKPRNPLIEKAKWEMGTVTYLEDTFGKDVADSFMKAGKELPAKDEMAKKAEWLQRFKKRFEETGAVSTPTQ